jgi:hypothetical protein
MQIDALLAELLGASPISARESLIDRQHVAVVVDVRAGRAVRHFKVVKSSNPEDLVFQSVMKGTPLRDNNILARHLKPAARKMGLDFVNWRCLAHLPRHLVEDGGCGRERRAGAIKTFSCLDHAGPVPAVRAGVAAARD